MSTTRMSDNRAALAMTREEADALFQEIAEERIRATVVAAGYEARMTAIKTAAADAKAQSQAILKPLQARLDEYIKAHAAEFQSPRMRQTEFGSYGVRAVTNIEVVDEAKAIASCEAQGLDAVVIVKKIDKPALKRAIDSGKTITGVEVRKGEVTKIDVAQKLVDQAMARRG